jgi:hypothetical protein
MKTSKTQDALQKAVRYQKLYQINAGFAGIIGHMIELQGAGLLSQKSLKYLSSFLQEIQAQTNCTVLRPIEATEEQDWSRNGRNREQWEKYFRRPRKK